MTKAWLKMSGTSTGKGASVLFLNFHWSFAILEPSGNGWPLPGTPSLYAWIIVGLATITLSTSSVRAEETTDQSSYPLKSENAIPLGDFSEYLSCAESDVKPRTASTAVAIATVSWVLRFMADPFVTRISIWAQDLTQHITTMGCVHDSLSPWSRSPIKGDVK